MQMREIDVKTAEGVASPAGAGRAGMKVECRVWERHACDLPAACQPVAARLDKDVRWPGQIRDLSAGGMGLVLSRRFERGAVLVAELPGAGGATVLARVVQVTPFSGGRWLLGCAFCSRLSEDRVRSLLGHVTSAPDGEDVVDLSGRPATNGGAPAQSVLRGVVLEGPVPGGGTARLRLRQLRLWGRWPLAEGTLLRVRLTTGGATLPDVRVRVCGCEPRGECWVVRYEFAEAPSRPLRRAFTRGTATGK
jgi:hypothetical protein